MNEHLVLAFEQLEPGQPLPRLEVQVTTSSIVTGAFATRDFHPVHHDLGYAKDAGHPALFLNIFSSNAYFERWIREWAGPQVILTQSDIRLGGPCYAGHTLCIDGAVSELGRDDGLRWADIQLKATCAAELHASGRMRLCWPVE